MCVQYMKIKSLRNSAPKQAFIPCGKCIECREKLKSQWAFRIRTEMQDCHLKGWKIGFFTLTYNDACLPHLPIEVFRSPASYVPVQCFSRKDVRTFIDSLRKELHRDYGVKGVKYMICCEYGKNTKRCHMHGILSWPSTVVKDDKVIQLTPKLIHGYICKLWTKGFVFPRDYRGGIDSHGYKHKQFELTGDIGAAAAYASKYCCKDLDYENSLIGLNLDFDSKLLRSCKSFHIQSKSLGLGYLSTLPVDKLLDIMKNGVSFVGLKRRVPIPIYIKNKILFDNKYILEPCKNGDWWYDFGDNKWRFKCGQGTHKRLVTKEASDFMIRFAPQIFEQKTDYYEQFFKDMCQPSFWNSKGVPCDVSTDIASSLTKRFLSYSDAVSVRDIASWYLAYYGVKPSNCYCVPLHYQWLSRYTDYSFGKSPKINPSFLNKLNYTITGFVECLKFCKKYNEQRRDKASLIADFYKSME